MPESLVTIEDVESRLVNTKYGQKTVWNVKASDGRRYGTFDAELGQLAGRLRGQAARIEYTHRQSHKDGNTYDNYDLKALEASVFSGGNGTTPNVQQSHSEAPVASQGVSRDAQGREIFQRSPTSYHFPDKDQSIARAVALKAAVELAAGGVIEDPTPNGLLTVSEVFTGWLLTGEGSPKAQVVPLVNRDTGDETDLATATDGSMLEF